MKRRAFLAWLGGTAAGVAAVPYLDLDKLLWVPGAKTIIIPDPPKLIAPASMIAGDIFTIDGLFGVNPLTRKSTGYLQQFVITGSFKSGEVVPIEGIWPAIDGSLKRGRIRPLSMNPSDWPSNI